MSREKKKHERGNALSQVFCVLYPRDPHAYANPVKKGKRATVKAFAADVVEERKLSS